MKVMQVDVVKRDAELWKGVQRGFLGSPVVPIAPIFGEAAQIADIGAISPGVSGRLIRKACAAKTRAQVGDVGIGNMQAEWSGSDRHDATSCRRCALRRYIALSASSSARLASACGPRSATPADAPALTARPPKLKLS